MSVAGLLPDLTAVGLVLPDLGPNLSEEVLKQGWSVLEIKKVYIYEEAGMHFININALYLSIFIYL